MGEVGFKIAMEREGLPADTARLLFRGQFKYPLTDRFVKELDRLIQHGIVCVEVDLKDLSYLDSTGLSAFLSAQRRLHSEGGWLKIVNPRRLIRHIFACANLDKQLDIGPAVEN